MPKERLHRLIAKTVQIQLPQGNLKDLLSHYKSCYDFGSIGPDALFNYTVLYNNKEALRQLSYAHQRENTAAFLQDYARDFKQTDAGWAYLLGALTHICADTVFHPAIYYYSGYKAKDKQAMRRHYRLEALLDFCISGLADPLPELNSLLPAMPLFELEDAFNALHFGRAPKRSIYEQAFKAHAFIERLLNNAAAGWLVSALAQTKWLKMQEYKALFYLGRPKTLASAELCEQQWQKEHAFLIPANGERIAASFAALMDRAAGKALKLFSQIEKAWETKEFSFLQAGNLETGLIGVAGEAMSYFSIKEPDELF